MSNEVAKGEARFSGNIEFSMGVRTVPFNARRSRTNYKGSTRTPRNEVPFIEFDEASRGTNIRSMREVNNHKSKPRF